MSVAGSTAGAQDSAVHQVAVAADSLAFSPQALSIRLGVLLLLRRPFPDVGNHLGQPLIA
jgi:hypothetical protein